MIIIICFLSLLWNLQKELEEMESADRITDRETMRKIIHRMMPVWEMLGKDNILRDFQRLLHDSDSPK